MNYMPGTASLIDEIDKKQQVVLRDGRVLIGYLRSVDQFANLVLNNTVERIHVGKMYGDVPLGFFVVRGENVVLLGEIDAENEEPKGYNRVSIETIQKAKKHEQQEKEEQLKMKSDAMRERGLVNALERGDDVF